MAINIKTIAYGLAGVLGAGAILLAALGKDKATWGLFLIAAIGLFVFSTFMRKL